MLYADGVVGIVILRCEHVQSYGKHITLRCTEIPELFFLLFLKHTYVLATLMWNCSRLLIIYGCILNTLKCQLLVLTVACVRNNKQRDSLLGFQMALCLHGLLFSHLPSNDLDAILTRYPVLSVYCHTCALLANPGSRVVSLWSSEVWRGHCMVLNVLLMCDLLSNPGSAKK